MTPSVRRRRRRRCSDDDATEADANADAKSRMMDIIICCNLTSRIGLSADVAAAIEVGVVANSIACSDVNYYDAYY